MPMRAIYVGMDDRDSFYVVKTSPETTTCIVGVKEDCDGNFTFIFIGRITDEERKEIMSAVIAAMP